MYAPSFFALRCLCHSRRDTWDDPFVTPADYTKSFEGFLVAETMGSIGVRDRVCGLCCVPRRGKGRQEGKPRHQEHRFGKEAAGLADTSCASGGEEWRIGICMSLQAGSRRKGSCGECARKWIRCWRLRKWSSGWAARRGEGQFHRG